MKQEEMCRHVVPRLNATRNPPGSPLPGSRALPRTPRRPPRPVSSRPGITARAGTPLAPPATHGLRIVYLTTDDPLYLPTFFDRVLGEHHARTEAVYIAPPLFKNQSTWQATLRYIRTFGMPAAQLTARVLDAKYRRRSIGTVCQKWGVHSAIVRDVNAPEFLDELRALSPDVIISVSCPLIFRKPLIELPPRVILNLHGAILPQYRGRDAGVPHDGQRREEGRRVDLLRERGHRRRRSVRAAHLRHPRTGTRSTASWSAPRRSPPTSCWTCCARWRTAR